MRDLPPPGAAQRHALKRIRVWKSNLAKAELRGDGRRAAAYRAKIRWLAAEFLTETSARRQ
jgi:hypothetical protein